MLLVVGNATAAAVLAARNADAEILGVRDLNNNSDVKIDAARLGEAIQFVANASVLGYDVRAAMVFYGEPGTPSLRAKDCEELWAQYGAALLQP
jgi:hypothetical protein